MSDHLGPHLVWVDDVVVRAGADADALDAAERALGRPLPAGARTFLSTNDGRQGELRDERDGTALYVRLHRVDEIVRAPWPDGDDWFEPIEETAVARGVELGDNGGGEVLVVVPEGPGRDRYVRYSPGGDEVLRELGSTFEEALAGWVHEFDHDYPHVRRPESDGA